MKGICILIHRSELLECANFIAQTVARTCSSMSRFQLFLMLSVIWSCNECFSFVIIGRTCFHCLVWVIETPSFPSVSFLLLKSWTNAVLSWHLLDSGNPPSPLHMSGIYSGRHWTHLSFILRGLLTEHMTAFGLAWPETILEVKVNLNLNFISRVWLRYYLIWFDLIWARLTLNYER